MGHEPDGGDRTGYAVVKYGIILVIVIVVLWFVARYLIPMLSDDEGEGPEFPPPPEQTLRHEPVPTSAQLIR